MAFKGGTSLSKVYGAINRFSEDVDITLDYRGFEDPFNPFDANASKNQIRKYSDRLKEHVRDYASETIIPSIHGAMEKIGLDPSTIRSDEMNECIWIPYPSVTEASDEYLRSEVLLELGGRNVVDPNETHEIRPEIESTTEDVEYPAANAVVLAPTRTFWEKATLVHVACHRGRLRDDPERLSRHWYDLSMLSTTKIGSDAIYDKPLLEEVVAHKRVFFNAGYANYEDCISGKFRLLPDQSDLDGLERDYTKMTQAGMIYGEAPDFKQLKQNLEYLEELLNCG